MEPGCAEQNQCPGIVFLWAVGRNLGCYPGFKLRIVYTQRHVSSSQRLFVSLCQRKPKKIPREGNLDLGSHAVHASNVTIRN